MSPFIVTRWQSPSAAISGQVIETTWPGWAAELQRGEPARAKEKLSGWSPGRFTPCFGPCVGLRLEHQIDCAGKRPHRCDNNASDLGAIVLDYDGKGTTIDQARALWAASLGLLHTTFRHTDASHRFRVVLVLSRLVTALEYDELWRVIAARAEGAGHAIDRATKDAARFWYMPHAGAHVDLFEGEPLDVDALLSEARVQEGAVRAAPVAPSAARAPTHVRSSRCVAYARAAVQGAAHRLAPVPDGSKHPTLVKEAYALGGLLHVGLDLDGVVDELLSALRAGGWDVTAHGPTARTLRDQLLAGQREPIDVEARLRDEDGRAASLAALSDDDERAAITAEQTALVDILAFDAPPAPIKLPEGVAPCSDTANGLRLLHWYGANLRYCKPLGGWFVWREPAGVWRQEEAAAMLLAESAARRMFLLAGDEMASAIKAFASATSAGGETAIAAAKKGKENATAAWAWAARSQNVRGLHAMLEAAESRATVEPSVFDADPWILNVANGTIDLKTGGLRKRRREDYCTKIAPAEFRGLDVTHPTLERYLSFVCEPHEGLREFMGLMMGLTLIGMNEPEAFFVAHGAENTGKSTLIHMLEKVLGSYAVAAAVETFLTPQGAAKGAGEARPDLVRLYGARLVTCSEVPKGRRFNEALVKQICSDTITARKLYEADIQFGVSFKVLMGCNDAPKIDPDERAIWRRLHLLPVDRIVPEEERDPAVKRDLSNPQVCGPAVLAMAVRGCLELVRGGWAAPACVKEATSAYREQQDPIKDWVRERCIVRPGDRDVWETKEDLRKDYDQWCREAGVTNPLGDKRFGERLSARGCTGQPRKVGGLSKRVWYGIRLKKGQDYALEEKLDAEAAEAVLQ